MADRNQKQDEAQHIEIEQIIASAVAEALQAQIPLLQAQIVRQVLDALPRQASAVPTATAAQSKPLVSSVAKIHSGSTQKEILRGLLDAGSEHCSRIALFVVKAGAASGWQSRGFWGGGCNFLLLHRPYLI